MIVSVRDLITFLKPFHCRWLAGPSLDPALIPAERAWTAPRNGSLAGSVGRKRNLRAVIDG
jgi:hypothetical protein